MERAVLSQRITSILSDISRLTNALYALNTTDIQRYPDNYEVLSTDAALRAERIACRLRHLLYATTSVTRDEYLTSAAVMQGIEIRSEDGILEITLPCLHPKRKQQQSTEYLLDPFTAALGQYVKSNPMPRLRHCVVCFSLIYSRDLPERRVRDYDNLELKQFLDVAASFLLTSGESRTLSSRESSSAVSVGMILLLRNAWMPLIASERSSRSRYFRIRLRPQSAPLCRLCSKEAM